jgi:hypothetical protein
MLAVLAAGATTVVRQSEAFSDCVHKYKNTKQYDALREGRRVVGIPIVSIFARAKLVNVCTWHFANADSGAIVALATIVLSVFTGTLWWSTRRLWKSATGQLHHLEQTTIHELRAYVLVSGARVDNVIDPSMREVRLTVRNFGKTPAKDVVVWMGTSIREFPLRGTFGRPPDTLRMGRDIIGPSRFTTSVVSVAGSTPQTEIALHSGTAAIFAFGEISYVDAFGIPRRTEFRHMCHGVGLATGNMAACESGNQYT